VLITLVLISEVTMACIASHMLSRCAQMKLHLMVALEAQKTGQTYKLMPDSIVVLEMIAKTPLVLESAEAEVTEDIVIERVVDMILQSVSVLEYALAQVTVVLMLGRLLDMTEKQGLGGKLDLTHAAPVLVRTVKSLRPVA
jgi:hypothetical protein